MPKIDYSDKQRDALFKGIFSGVINDRKLPKKLYKATADLLNDAMDGVFGESDPELLNELRNNIYIFSAAKTYQQVVQMQSFLTENNKGLDYKTFKDRVKGTYDTFNEGYLESEYITAQTSAQNAINYREAIADKDLFTMLRYTAILDSTTSEICKRLDGTIAKTDDKIWHTCSPPAHWRCRCHLEKIDKYDNPKASSDAEIKSASEYANENKQDVFKNNSGISAKVFDDKHPYFNVPKKDKAYAKRNFDMTIPKK